MNATLGFAAIQMTVTPGPGNLERMRLLLAHLRETRPWVEMAMFSELCLYGVNRDWAEPLPGPTSEALAGLAREFGLWLVPGTMYERTPEGVYNTALVFSPRGELVRTYRKIFTWRPVEQSLPGHEFCVFDVPLRNGETFRFGLAVCYDQWFPEMVRQLAWMGAKAVLNPVLTSTPDRAQEIILGQANAIANQVYFLSANGLGHGGLGQSFLADPEGAILARAGGEAEEILAVTLDLEVIRRVREYGAAGVSQVLKRFRDSPIRFPVYDERGLPAEGLQDLGPLREVRLDRGWDSAVKEPQA